MTTIRVSHNREHPFVILNKEGVRDPKLSLKAKGLWAYMLSFPDDWEFNITHLINTLKEGRRAITTAMDELFEAGYMVQLQFNGSVEDGTHGFQKNNLMVFEFPLSKEEIEIHIENEMKKTKGTLIKKRFTDVRFAHAQNPQSKNALLLSNDRDINNEITNTYAPSKDDAHTPTSSSLSDSKRRKPKPQPKKPYRTLCRYERVSHLPSQASFVEHFKFPLVCTSNEEHEKLIKKHGEEKLAKGYEILADWKLSKAETDPSVLSKHIDYHRLTKWVMKEVGDPLTKKLADDMFRRRGKLAISGDIRAMAEKRTYVSAEITDPEEIKRVEKAYQEMKKKAQESQDKNVALIGKL